MDADIADCLSEMMTDRESRRDRALAIKACLNDLRNDARACALRDLDRFLELAAMAADEAAASLGPVRRGAELRYARVMGKC